MLDELAVHNLGVLPEAHFEPGPGLVVITGETGAGKTLLLGALRLLRGEQARTELVGAAGDEASAEGRFIIDGAEVTVQRRIVGGRSRAYLDGAMASADALAERLGSVIEVVAQHEHLALSRPASVRALIDAELADPAVLDEYRDAHASKVEVLREQTMLGGDRMALERELDMMRFQSDEIAAAGFAEGDDATLERDARRIRNAEEIAELAAATTAHLDSAVSSLEAAFGGLTKIGRLDDGAASLVGSAESALEALRDLEGDVRAITDDLDHDPARLAALEARVALLGDLRRKYGASLGEVLAYGEEAAARAGELTGLLGRAADIGERLQAAEARLLSAGSALRAARTEAADRLAAAARAHLVELGFSDPVVAIDVAESEPGPAGADVISIGFASDRALPPGPVAKVASGGELSRLVLALRLAAGVADAPVIAFDEIDAGIGGATALAMGRKLAALAEGRQVLCVTHLPQVAAFAETHYVVERTGPSARLRRVDGEERLEELSRMLAGLPDSERGRSHAEELLGLAAAR